MAGIGLAEVAEAVDARLADADAALDRLYPGARPGRQPVHTVYVPADQISPGLAADWGRRALAALDEHAPDAAALAAAVGAEEAAVAEALPRVRAKLAAEPVEDLRIDFEDGYGARSDAEEDGHVAGAVAALAADLKAGTAPPTVGLRAKGMEAAGRRRGLRTLALFIDGLLEAAGALPENFVFTLPKITSVDQVAATAWAAAELERRLGLPEGRLRFELQVETAQSLVTADGAGAVSQMIQAGAGRVTALHYGTYDYSASLGVTAAFQSMAHPAADHAKAVMQLAAAGTGVWLSDGSTNVLPVGSRGDVHAAWKLHAGLVRRSLERAFYQGWDLHPHQLPTRYLATFHFFREAFPPAAKRLRDYLSAQGGGVLDEPATAQALAGALIRGTDCGALAEDEVEKAVGAPIADLRALTERRVG
ncbi:DUF6986 family protein [Nocardiopsis coralliicola]